MARETATVSNTGVEGFDPARLRAARERVGLTQRALAEQLVTAVHREHATAGRDDLSLNQLHDLSRRIESVRSKINYYEAGKRQPRVDMLHLLGQALAVSPLELLEPGTPATLATLRAQYGLRQSDVADHLGCSRAHYARVEAGTAAVHADDRQRLAALFKISTDELEELIGGATTVGTLVRQRATS